MLKLTARQESILALIVREFVHAPSPVSSRLLVEKYALTLSSATIRNDMMALEEAGLITAPHTSAGRIPTEAGYRYFVQKLLGETELTGSEQRTIQHQFHQVSPSVDDWLRLAASVLAQTARSASIVTSPQPAHARFKHLELVATHGRSALLVLVLEGGDLRQQMLTLAEPVEQARISATADIITALCAGLDSIAIAALAARQDNLEREVMELIADMLLRADTRHRILHYDGLSNILDPDHYLDLPAELYEAREEGPRSLLHLDGPGARQALHLLEEQSLIEEVLADALSPTVGDVQVMIAGEGRWEALRHTSMIISRYGVHGQATGAVGVLGPTRLHYGRAISAVRYIAGLMSEMMFDLYGPAANAR